MQLGSRFESVIFAQAESLSAWKSRRGIASKIM